MTMDTGRALYAQAEWEAEGWRRMAQRYRDARETADPLTLPPARKVLHDLVPLVVKRIEAAIEGSLAANGGSGRGVRAGTVGTMLGVLAPEQLALITVGTVIRGVPRSGVTARASSGANTVTALAQGIAAAIRAQIEYEAWRKAAKDTRELAAFDRTYRAPNERVWVRWRKKVAEARLTEWSEKDALALGAALIAYLVAAAAEADPAAPVFCEVTTRRNIHLHKCVILSPAGTRMLTDLHARAELVRPPRLPMIIPPRPWEYTEDAPATGLHP